MNDYVTSYFLAGAGMSTLPMYIFSSLKIGISPKISAVSIAVVALSSIQLLAVWALGARRSRRSIGARIEPYHSNVQTMRAV